MDLIFLSRNYEEKFLVGANHTQEQTHSLNVLPNSSLEAPIYSKDQIFKDFIKKIEAPIRLISQKNLLITLISLQNLSIK